MHPFCVFASTLCLQVSQITLLPTSTIICDTSTGAPCPFVPASLHRTVFNALYSLSIQECERLTTSHILSYLLITGTAHTQEMAGQTCTSCDETGYSSTTLHVPGQLLVTYGGHHCGAGKSGQQRPPPQLPGKLPLFCVDSTSHHVMHV